MSYYSWVEDIGEEVANALDQFLGEELPDHEETAFPKPDTVAAMRPLLDGYHATLDAEVIHQMVEITRHIDMGDQDDPIPMRGKGLKNARRDFQSLVEHSHYKAESVFRWFMVHSEKMNLGIADDTAMRAAYGAHWIAEFARLLKVVEGIAIERDNNDDQFYEWEAAMGEDDA
ncbi:MAG: hypothetical protein EOP84_29250 [Verrucomicrobiaceae bacterium]|nr:MAG: hypothetical protein EOP84_29250 [Verrucomicrobiaceae bacterium]